VEHQDEGARLRDDGIDRAVAHADRVTPKWSQMAYEELRAFLIHTGLHEFTSEHVRDFAEAWGFVSPPDKRAWGGVMMRAARAGLIRKTRRFTPSMNPNSHKMPKALWVRV
jgi:hypothetical protein